MEATDPNIPDDVAARLRSQLMRARRDVGAARRDQDTEAERNARARVHTAKVALGERGTPWWEQNSAERQERWQRGLNALEQWLTDPAAQRTSLGAEARRHLRPDQAVPPPDFITSHPPTRPGRAGGGKRGGRNRSINADHTRWVIVDA